MSATDTFLSLVLGLSIGTMYASITTGEKQQHLLSFHLHSQCPPVSPTCSAELWWHSPPARWSLGQTGGRLFSGQERQTERPPRTGPQANLPPPPWPTDRAGFCSCFLRCHAYPGPPVLSPQKVLLVTWRCYSGNVTLYECVANVSSTFTALNDSC